MEIIKYSNKIEKNYIKSHIVIGAGGVSMMERLFFNIPSFIITISKNQFKGVNNLRNDGYIYFLGYKKFNKNILKNVLDNYYKNNNRYLSDVKKLSKLFNKSDQKTIVI